jgi:glycosyltransferase involved in cell wall biosynthesis
MSRGTRAAWLALHVVPASLATVAYALVVAPISRVRAAFRRRRGGLPAILWGPVPIANLRNSTAADRLYGYRSETLVYRPFRPEQAAAFDHVLDLPVPILRQLVPYAVLVRAGLRYDVFCFYFDGGLLAPTPFWRLELPLLRLAGKKVVVWPYGGDARLASATRARGGWHAYSDVAPGTEDRDEAEVRRHLEAFGRWADVLLGCADLVEDLPRLDGVLPYPFDSKGWEPVQPGAGGPVRIAHASNHRHYKGTRWIVAAVEELQREGHEIELTLVEGVDNAEARRIYADADVIVDQLLIGAYALFAIEGMALGKPVVCYLNDRFRPHHPEWEDCPIVSATPDTIADVLRDLVLDAPRRRELGARGPEYVRRVHSPEAVGARLDAIYRRLWGCRAAAHVPAVE